MYFAVIREKCFIYMFCFKNNTSFYLIPKQRLKNKDNYNTRRT